MDRVQCFSFPEMTPQNYDYVAQDIYRAIGDNLRIPTEVYVNRVVAHTTYGILPSAALVSDGFDNDVANLQRELIRRLIHAERPTLGNESVAVLRRILGPAHMVLWANADSRLLERCLAALSPSTPVLVMNERAENLDLNFDARLIRVEKDAQLLEDIARISATSTPAVRLENVRQFIDASVPLQCSQLHSPHLETVKTPAGVLGTINVDVDGQLERAALIGQPGTFSVCIESGANADVAMTDMMIGQVDRARVDAVVRALVRQSRRAS